MVTYLLVVEAADTEGYGGWLPDLPGLFPIGASVQEVEQLAITEGAYLLQELADAGQPVPPPQNYSRAQVAQLVKDFQARGCGRVHTAFVELPLPKQDACHQEAAHHLPAVKGVPTH